MVVEQCRNLLVDILDGLVVHPVHVEYAQECLVDVVLLLEPALDLVDETDGLHEIDGLLLEVLGLDRVALGQEGVEAEDEFGVAIEEGLDPDDDAGGVDPGALEVAHDLEELLVLGPVVLELVLDGLEVDEGVVGGELLAGRRRCGGGRRRWRRRGHVAAGRWGFRSRAGSDRAMLLGRLSCDPMRRGRRRLLRCRSAHPAGGSAGAPPPRSRAERNPSSERREGKGRQREGREARAR